MKWYDAKEQEKLLRVVPGGLCREPICDAPDGYSCIVVRRLGRAGSEWRMETIPAALVEHSPMNDEMRL